MKTEKKVKIFSSFLEENKAKYQRRSRMNPEERCKEFSALQERAWGKGWTSVPIKKIVRYEKVTW